MIELNLEGSTFWDFTYYTNVYYISPVEEYISSATQEDKMKICQTNKTQKTNTQETF